MYKGVPRATTHNRATSSSEPGAELGFTRNETLRNAAGAPRNAADRVVLVDAGAPDTQPV